MNESGLQHSGNPVLKAVHARHSVRSYAPTAIHQEPWTFVVMQDHALLLRLSGPAKPLLVGEARHRNAQGISHSSNISLTRISISPMAPIRRS